MEDPTKVLRGRVGISFLVGRTLFHTNHSCIPDRFIFEILGRSPGLQDKFRVCGQGLNAIDPILSENSSYGEIVAGSSFSERCHPFY